MEDEPGVVASEKRKSSCDWHSESMWPGGATEKEGAWSVAGADKEGGWQGGALAREELNLLAKLIGSATVAKARDTFNLNLFDDPNEEEQQALLEEVKNYITYAIQKCYDLQVPENIKRNHIILSQNLRIF